MIPEILMMLVLLAVGIFCIFVLPWYLALFILIFLFIFYLSWYDKRKFKKLQVSYNPDDDLSRKGEARKRELGSFERASRKPTNTNSPSRFKPLPTTPVVLPEQDSNSVGKTSPSPRGFLAKLRRTNAK